jgi:Domain of unknown function (DUF4124)
MAQCFLRTVCAAFVLVLALPAATATAQTIYRSVDAHGNVSYSDQPPRNAVNVEEVGVQPGPSDAAQREARERVQRDQAKANEMREAREQRLQQQQAAQPAAAGPPTPAEREDPVDYYQPYPDPYSVRRDQIRNRPDRQPVQRPDRPVQLPARPESR